MGPVACQVNPNRFHHFLPILLSVFDELFFQPPMSVSERVEKRVGSFSRRRQGREGGLQGLSLHIIHIRSSILSNLPMESENVARKTFFSRVSIYFPECLVRRSCKKQKEDEDGSDCKGKIKQQPAAAVK